MRTNSSKRRKAVSMLLALTLVLRTLPLDMWPMATQVVNAAPASNPDPTYDRVKAPEVAFFNAINGTNDKFYVSVMGNKNYNAVEAGYFGSLRYDTKVTGTQSYSWSGFAGSNIFALRKNNSDIKMGYSVTRTSNEHSHSAYVILTYEMNAWSNTSLGFGLGGLANNGVFDYTGYNTTTNKYRAGNKVFKTFVPQDGKSLDLAFNVSPIRYNDNKDVCGCGGTSEGCAVCFFDGNAPYFTQIYIRDANGAYCTNFKPGDSVNIVLTCSEPIRFADDSKSGKGNVYIALKLNGSTNKLYAHLTKLEGNQLTFTYTAPTDLTEIYDVAGIDLTIAPAGGTPLINNNAVVTLKQLNANGAFSVSLPEGTTDEKGYTKTTSPVTDMAGNPVYLNGGDKTNIARSFNIDGEKPYVAEVHVVADTKNADVKEILSQRDDLPEGSVDVSDRYLGVGDTMSLRIYMNEVVKFGWNKDGSWNNGGKATLTTNIKKQDGTYVSFEATPSSNVNAVSSNLGTQYGRGASNGEVTVLISSSVAIEKGMTIDNDKGTIKITKVEYTDMKDLAGNPAAAKEETPNAKEQYMFDTTAPTVSVENVTGANATDYGFWVSFKVADDRSGVQGMLGYLKLGGGTKNGELEYAVTGDKNPTDKTVWYKGAENMELLFVESGATQYLHVKKLANQFYDVSKLYFILSDYAGNKEVVKDVSVTGVGFDMVGPTIIAGNSSRTYDNTENKGILIAEINAEDPSGVSSVQYLWNDGEEVTAESDGWNPATGTMDDTTVTATVSVDVPSQTAFKKTLWIKATDTAGNVSVKELGAYSYSLERITYDMEYPVNVVTEPTLKIDSIQEKGALVFDVQKPGDSDTHYVLVANSPDTDIFDFASQWYTAELDTTDGIKYTNLQKARSNEFTQADDHFTGNMSVKVYAGRSNIVNTEDAKDISRSVWGYDSTADIIITNNAAVEEFTLKVSWKHNYNARAEVFSKSEFSVSPDRAGTGGYTTPWDYDETYAAGRSYHISALKEVQVSFDLGVDVNGWDFEDIDWESSCIKLKNEDTGEEMDICKLSGSGPKQTITLPDVKVETGYYNLTLYLMRRSAPDWAAYRWSKFIYIDTTEPGSLKLETFAKASSYSDATAAYEALTFDSSKTIFIPTQQCDTYLSVDVLNPDGTSHEMTKQGTYLNVGEVSIIAWNTAEENPTIINLKRECLEKDDQTGELSLRTLDDADNTSKRLLRFGIKSSGTSNYMGRIGLEPDQDNVIAIQVRYSNDKYTEPTYLTIHPISIGLSGTTTTLPVRMATWMPNPSPLEDIWTGPYTADPGKGVVVFTPDAEHAGVIASSGLRLYCRLGEVGYLWKSTLSNKSFAYHSAFTWADASQPMEMIDQGDGSYAATVPVYEKSVKDVLDAYKTDGKFGEIYCIYAEDIYGNRVDVSYAPTWIIADGTAPVISDASVTVDANGKFTATYRVYDDSLYSSTGVFDNPGIFVTAPPMELNLSFNNEYAQKIGALGGGLTLTADVRKGDYVWTATDSNTMGIRKVTASLVRDDDYRIEFFGFKIPTDVYLTVTVEGYVSPQITSATDMTLNLKATDGHGNACDEVGATASVTGVTPTVIDKQYKKPNSSYTNYALFLTFNVPVQPEESWINRSIEGFATEWHDAFPIWKDGTWDITFTDVFGTKYTQSLTLDNVIGRYGFDLSFSNLDYVAASEGVTVTFIPDSEDERVTYGGIAGSYTFTENGTYYLTWEGQGESDSLPIHLNNIVSGGPEETLFFYFEEFKDQYVAGSSEQFRGTTTAPVTVSYRTSRETNPVGETTLTFKDGDNDTFTFQYYDIPTAFTYTITGKLSDYGITLSTPPVPYADVDAPTIELVSIWKQQGGGFVQTEAFPGNADEAAVKTAIANAGVAQGYDFVVQASDYSKWKVVVKSSVPTSMSYASAASDTISGVSVSGNNILITKAVTSDFYVVVVDNATADSAATSDNFTCIKIPYGSYHFDTSAPEIVTDTVADGLYSRTVYIKAKDQDDAGNDTSSSVTISGAGVIQNSDANAAEYPYKLVFTNNETVMTINAVDAAGNSVSANIQVNGIDVSAPVLKVTWSPCFQDPVTGKLDRSSPTLGPVSTDVVAHVTSDKDIMNVTATYTYYGYTYPYDFKNSNSYWGYIEYTSQRVSVHFTESSYNSDTIVTLNITAPNGQTTSVELALKPDTIDKYEPFIIVEDFDELKRDGYDVPYAVVMHARPTEEVYCTNYGPVGTLYYDDADQPHWLEVTLRDYSQSKFFFVDKAGNRAELDLAGYYYGPSVPYFDFIAPTIRVDVPENANATNGTISVTVTANEKCTLSCDDSTVTCGAMSLQGTDSEGNEIWTGVVKASANGTFRVTAADAAGNTTSEIFTVNNVDKTLPIILFDHSTINLRQDSEASALTVLLDQGITTWDNVALEAGSLAYDASGVLLSTVGVYPVTYTVKDMAGNVGQAVRYVKVVDKNQPIISVDGTLTEENGTTSLDAGKHTLSVAGLKNDNEPYTLKLVKGIWSSGQMKKATKLIPVGDDGSFTADNAGFYTVLIVTQSRQTYRTLLYVEK